MPKAKKKGFKIPQINIPKIPNVEQIDFKRMYTTEIDDNVDQFFSKAELAEMGDYEKSRYKNMKRNYLMILEFGLPAIKPEFMKGPSYRARKRKVEVESSESSDEEWTPNLESKQNAKKQKDNCIGGPLKLGQVTEKSKDATTTNKKRTPRPKKDKEDVSKPGNTSATRVLRERNENNFMNLEAPDDDHFLYCEECNKEYDIDCPVHGPLKVVADTEVLKVDVKENHSLKTLPHGLSVRTSSIPNAGQGVFADIDFETRTRLGPYGGDIVNDYDTAHASGYCWQVYKDGKPSHFVDAQNTSTANWMRYVNCAPSEVEQNLVAFQFKGEIYYRSYKPIAAGTELLVWYGSEYGRELGVVRVNSSLLTPTILNGEELFSCLYCRTGFSSAKHYIGHLRIKHGDKLNAANIRMMEGWLSKFAMTTHNEQLFKEQRGKVEKKEIIFVSNENNNSSQSCVKSKRALGISKYNKEITNDDETFACHLSKNNLTSFNCNKCSYTCFNKDNLMNHLRTDSCDRPYKCDVCGKRFTQQGDLQKHFRIHTGGRPYTCDVCGKGFTLQHHLQRHLRIHTGERPYKCDVCGKGFTVQCALQTHVRIHTGERPYKCDVCGKGFTVQCALQTHVRIHTGERPYKCDVCGKGFTQQGDLQKHMRIHTGERPYKCDVCGKGFTVQCALQTHVRIHTGERPYKCDVCGKGFTQQGDLQKHMRIHTGERPYKCDVCGKGFTQQGDLQKHMRIHTGERPYKCDVCGKGFTVQCALQTHVRIHTGERPYKCDVCGKGFTQQGDLQKHMRIHTGERPYKCDVCGKGFTVQCALQTHVRIHTGERPYKCDVCGKGFTQQGDLQKHMRIHTGERPYNCDVCGKGFIEQGNLQKHLRIHTGERPYKCDVCGKGFTVQCALQKHMRIHTGERPYKCDVCGKGFIEQGNLQKHMRIHTGERPYKCDVCGKAFARLYSLQSHRRNHS